ncbi:hypothetical protein ACIA8O_01055 [Kitasatospora sp. NPDC051853]|uniref:hypothetical protein n=1 Tax=Kitasatospora sp. NPDC051853 TaxID=3364058 RepID=UPI00379F07CE
MYFDQDEPQDVRDRRLAGEREERRRARGVAPLELGDAHVGAGLVVVGVVVLVCFGTLVGAGVVLGVFGVWFGVARAWVQYDGGRGWHAMGRAYGLTFGWGGGF